MNRNNVITCETRDEMSQKFRKVRKTAKMAMIRKGLARHCGGLTQFSSDAQLLIVWDSLDDETKKRYLANLETQTIHTRKETHAASIRTL